MKNKKLLFLGAVAVVLVVVVAVFVGNGSGSLSKGAFNFAPAGMENPAVEYTMDLAGGVDDFAKPLNFKLPVDTEKLFKPAIHLLEPVDGREFYSWVDNPIHFDWKAINMPYAMEHKLLSQCRPTPPQANNYLTDTAISAMHWEIIIAIDGADIDLPFNGRETDPKDILINQFVSDFIKAPNHPDYVKCDWKVQVELPDVGKVDSAIRSFTIYTQAKPSTSLPFVRRKTF